MPKPSILQTLLRQPSQSYSTRSDSSSSSQRGSSIHSGRSSSLYSTNPDSRGTLSHRLDSSTSSGTSGEGGRGGWEWSVFGGRKGLTGGPASLRAPSEIVRAVKGSSNNDDSRSLRSSRSLGSVRSRRSADGKGDADSWSLRSVRSDSKPGKEKTSRRYSDAPPVPTVPAPDPRPRHSFRLAPDARTLHKTTSEPNLSPNRHSYLSDPSPPSLPSSQPPSLTSSSASSATSEQLLTPAGSVVESAPPPPEIAKKKKGKRRERNEYVEEYSDRGRDRWMLASVDEGNEDAAGSRPQSVVLDAVLDDAYLTAPESPESIRRTPASPRVTFAEPARSRLVLATLVETGESQSSPEGQLLPATVAVLDRFAGPAPTLLASVEYPTEMRDSLVTYPPTFTPSASAHSVQLASTADVFSSLPSETARPPSPTPTPPPDSTPSSLPALSEPAITSTPPPPAWSSPAKPLPSRISQLSFHSPSSSISSNYSSSTETSSPATDVSPNPQAFSLPSFRLTRTESDQRVLGVTGSTPLSPPSTPSLSSSSPSLSSSSPTFSNPPTTQRRPSLPPPVIPAKSPERPRARTTTPPVAQYEIIARTSPTAPRRNSLTSANLASASAASDSPQWARNVRALGDPNTTLVPRRANSLTTRPKIETAAPRWTPPTSRSASPDSSRRAPRHREITPKSSTSTSTSSSPAVETTIPRRRTKSLHPQIVELGKFPTPSSSRTYDSPIIPDLSRPFTPESLSLHTMPLPFLDSPPRAFLATPPRTRPTSLASSTGALSATGLSTMSVPVGAYRPSKHPHRISHTLNQPHATMNALSVSANAALALRRRSISLFSSSSSTSEPTDPDRPLVPHQDFRFGPLQPPPKKIGSGEVLVEVLAVGLDMWDFERARERASTADGFGFIPGRSFCGKVVECGVEANKVRRGDFVFGLQELKKSGALAELMTVDRNLLTIAPACGISVEEIAALPLAGISAIQVMEALCSSLPKGSKILVLNAHEGVGNLCMQLAVYLRPAHDLWIVAQCPTNLADGEVYCRATGASEVVRDEPLASLNGLHESSFDVVIDTIGGRRLYDASRRVLHFSGQFITTVGDSLSAPTPSTLWKTNIRSLRRAFFPKDKKTISYWAVNLDEREHPRDALDKLRGAVEEGGVRPAVRRVVEFAEAATAFDEEMGAGVVVRISEA